MEKEKTLTDLLTDLELSVHRCRKVYAHETTDRIEAEIESDKQQSTISNLQIKNDKQQRTIRHLRREVRRLRSLLKTKDRLLASQSRSMRLCSTTCKSAKAQARNLWRNGSKNCCSEPLNPLKQHTASISRVWYPHNTL